MAKGGRSKSLTDDATDAREALQPTDDMLKVPEKDTSHIKSATSVLATFEAEDGGWGWVVCAASFYVNGAAFGLLNVFGIFLEYLKELAEGQGNVSSKVSLVGSICVGVTFSMSIPASILTDLFGVRKVSLVGAVLATAGMLISSFVKKLEILYVTYGVMTGVGLSLIYTPSLVVLGHYFHKRMGIVNGLVTFGSAVFTIALPFALTELLKAIGLSNTYRVLAGMMAVLILCALSFRPRIPLQPRKPAPVASDPSDKCPRKTALRIKRFLGFCPFNRRIWKKKGYIVWCVGFPLAMLGYFIPFVYIMDYVAQEMPDYTKYSQVLVMLLGGVSGVSRLACGKLSDWPRVNRIRMQQIGLILLGALTIIIPVIKSFWVLVGIAVLMGLCDGIIVCMIGPIAFDLVGPSSASQAIGFLLGFLSIPLMAGPAIGGAMYDALGSYKIPFHCAGVPAIVGALLLFCIPRHKQHFPAVPQAEDFSPMVAEHYPEEEEDEEDDEYTKNYVSPWGIWKKRNHREVFSSILNMVGLRLSSSNVHLASVNPKDGRGHYDPTTGTGTTLGVPGGQSERGWFNSVAGADHFSIQRETNHKDKIKEVEKLLRPAGDPSTTASSRKKTANQDRKPEDSESNTDDTAAKNDPQNSSFRRKSTKRGGTKGDSNVMALKKDEEMESSALLYESVV